LAAVFVLVLFVLVPRSAGNEFASIMAGVTTGFDWAVILTSSFGGFSFGGFGSGWPQA
jgi:hypothetical protein